MAGGGSSELQDLGKRVELLEALWAGHFAWLERVEARLEALEKRQDNLAKLRAKRETVAKPKSKKK